MNDATQAAHRPRVTARVHTVDDGDVYTAYTVDGETYHDVDRVEAVLRGEQPWV